MKRYYYQLVDEQYDELGAFIPDGSHKETAENRAKVWMRENNVSEATLVVNSMRTDNILDMILITIK
ncbi:MAG: hypothetical protein K2M41_00015 [Muribaculaceae bacterium]|nr:hypothetical protein [Muribaculaceae bacterium]